MPNQHAIPDGYGSVTPYLTFRDAAAAMQWYAHALNAQELARLSTPEGRIAHAEILIGNSRVMVADESAWPVTKVRRHWVARRSSS